MKKHSKVAKRYAQTLFGSLGIDDIEKLILELSLVNMLIERDRSLRAVFSSPMFFEKDQLDAIDLIAVELKLTKLCKGFVLNVIKKKDIDKISDILAMLTRFYLSAKNMVRAVVITSARLDEQRHKRLRDSLRAQLNKEVEIEYVIDPSIMGGIVVKAGGYVFDVSLKGQLAKLREALLKG
ncbi:MAG: ATP synthase F1 subunit delta [Candidatus Magnetobacterium sp. LHC-1]|uniref:ATP synthase subunit delta n=1 Tax=Candidatus Magnetobacterium casense TaxID=1455061 RepID=A0ABS6RVA9_9BACT|nr:ATP synthase F1 subunit delta [Candidatus Magnetobacterium casensis]MBF0606668.1 ATP synthase F1 subunit delta [Nitrospirota bacterium]MBV6340285.1 ATP synthase F1 subunit delta [Candidatus Magnetobacterium casensis]